MAFAEASPIAGDLTRTAPGRVIKPGDTNWDEARRSFNLRMDSTRPWWSTLPTWPISQRLSATPPVAQQSIPLVREP